MKDFKVIKKNGREEDFDLKKVIKSCKAAGASEKVCKQIAKEIIEELPKIESTIIRELILKKLEKLDHEAHKSWLQYDIREKQR